MRFIHFQNSIAPKVEKDIAATIVDGMPRQFSTLIYKGHQGAISSGIWKSTAGSFSAVMDHQVEFCHILAGAATIETEAGEVFEVKAGDAFVMESGLKTLWKVADHIKKHFVICSVKDLPA